MGGRDARIAGDHQRGNAHAELFADRCDCIESVLVPIEAQVRDDQVRIALEATELRERVACVASASNGCPPGREERTHAFDGRRVVIDNGNGRTLESASGCIIAAFVRVRLVRKGRTNVGDTGDADAEP